jgi:hypothetical protein
MANQQGVSLRPSDLQHSTGLIDDADLTVKEAKFLLYDYNGTVQNATLALGLILVDDEGKEYEQYFSAGDPKHFVPSKDGKRAIQVGQKTGLNDNSNFAMFIMALVNAGFPEDQLSDDVSAFEGLYAHWNRQAQPERSGLAQGQKQEKGREKSVLVPTKILSMPGEAKKGATKGKATTAATKAAPAKANGSSATAPSDDLDAAATDAVLTVIGDAGGSIEKTKLSPALFKQLAKDPNRNKIVQMAFKDDFLAADGRPWQYDGATISLG